MVRISSVVFSLFVAACAVAAPMQRRQIGDLDCNLARLQLLFNIKATQNTLNTMNATDLHTQSAVAVAQAGLTNATNVIQGIFGALSSGQLAPAASRDQTVLALNHANASLAMIKDPSLNATVAAAMSTVLAAGNQANAVGADCN
ncbi:hypothetical protein K438DRAFT_1660002 [Mycena galopus ATCC 62051]|nr:hypothetical protein K438DRAFT_1660002 [Mycena galopus ATCC 62051]